MLSNIKFFQIHVILRENIFKIIILDDILLFHFLQLGSL